MVTLYSTGCPKCMVLEKKLNAKGIEFTIQDDEYLIMELATRSGIFSMPLLLVDDEVMDFAKAVNWVNEHE